MGKKHFIEEQIAYALRQQESGTPVAELTPKLGVGEHMVNSHLFSPQGDAIAIATHDGKVTVWAVPFVK